MPVHDVEMQPGRAGGGHGLGAGGEMGVISGEERGRGERGGHRGGADYQTSSVAWRRLIGEVGGEKGRVWYSACTWPLSVKGSRWRTAERALDEEVFAAAPVIQGGVGPQDDFELAGEPGVAGSHGETSRS
jgi:hypothetical protein